MTPRSAGAHVTFFDPTPRRTLACRLGLHRPTVAMGEGWVSFTFYRRLTCPCQRFVWLSDESGRTFTRFWNSKEA